MNKNKILPNKLFFLGLSLFSMMFCQSSNVDDQSSNNPPSSGEDNSAYVTASVWLTKADETIKLQKQTDIYFKNTSNNYQTIEIDAAQKYQTIDGFGYTLTGGSGSGYQSIIGI